MNTPYSTSYTPRWIYFAWMLILGIVFIRLGTPDVDASHRRHFEPFNHQNKMHEASAGRGFWDHEYCVDSRTPYISDSAALNAVDHALFSTGYPRWDLLQPGDGTADGRVELWGMSEPCYSYTQTQRNEIEIEIMVYKDQSEVPNVPSWCPENKSCTEKYKKVWSSRYNHWDFKWHWIFLDLDNMPNTYETDTLVNHEMGHVFGLWDGGTYDSYTCPPGESIMHNWYYRCPNVTRNVPSVNDLNSVKAGASGSESLR